MSYTWSQMSFLSAAQQNKAQQLADIGNAVIQYRRNHSTGPAPDTSSVTYSQAKAAEVILKDLRDLIGPAATAVDYIRDLNRQSAINAMESSNP